MSEYRGLDFLDCIIILLKWKKLFILLGIIFLSISYLTIFFFIPPQYDSKSVIVASDSDQTGGIGSLMKTFTNLPISIPGLQSGADTDLFTTVIYSRTNLEKIIEKFDLYEEYGMSTMDETLKELINNISAEETKEGAYEIVVRASSPKKSADMTNYIVENLNQRMLELNIAKSRDNRIFLEKRYNDIKINLKTSEDSLVLYQKKSGILLAEEQAVASFEAYAKLEAELASKQIEYSVLKKINGEDSPLTQQAKIAVDEFDKR